MIEMCETPSTTTTTTQAPTTTTAAIGRKRREIHTNSRQKHAHKRQVKETELEEERRSYGSVLRYECGLARMFMDPELEELYQVNVKFRSSVLL